MQSKYLFLFFIINSLSGFGQVNDTTSWYFATKYKNSTFFINTLPVIDLTNNNDYDDEYNNKKTKITKVKHWVKTTYKSNSEKFGKKYVAERKELYEFDLTQKQIRRITSYIYGLDGNVLYENEEEDKFSLVIPETIGESMYYTVIKIYADKAKAIIDKEKFEKDKLEKQKLIAESLISNITVADDLFATNQVDSALAIYQTQKKFIDEYGDKINYGYLNETFISDLETKIDKTKNKIILNKKIELALFKADSVYKVDIKESLSYYNFYLTLHKNPVIHRKIDEIKSTLELNDFKTLITSKKLEFDSLQNLKSKNDSTIIFLTLVEKEYFLKAYEVLNANFSAKANSVLIVKNFYSYNNPINIIDNDVRLQSAFNGFNKEFNDFITLQKAIIETDKKVLKRQNKELKKCNYQVEAILNIIENRTPD